MKTIIDFFRHLSDTSDWPPRWHCGKWTDFHGWLYIVSDLMIWSAYFTIPVIIFLFVRRKRLDAASFRKIFLLFAAFILACGTTHLVDAAMFWIPAYRVNALMRFITGVVSWATALTLVRIAPAALLLRTPTEFERELRLRQKAEHDLSLKNQELEEAQRLARMGSWAWDLTTDQIHFSDSLCEIWEMEPDPNWTFRGFIQSVHPADRELIQNVVQEAIQTGIFPETHFRIHLPSGTTKHILARGAVHFDESGRAIRMNGTDQDITADREQMRRLEAQNRLLRTIAAIQSHKVRGPLATIMGLTAVIERTGGPNDELLDGLVEKAAELDRAVHRIVEITRARI